MHTDEANLNPIPGPGGLPMIPLMAADGARAEVLLHGAQVTSWIPAGGTERLFLSPRAGLAAGKAIRGGIPVIFPQFASLGPLPSHGFARVSPWRLLALERRRPPGASAVLQLVDTEATRALWPHRFESTVTATVGGSALEVRLAVRNTGEDAFAFTAALHTYVRVDDVRRTTVAGLRGLRYFDKAGGGIEREETEDEVRFAGEVDRIYYDAPPRVLVREPDRTLEVISAGFRDVVVWNPGPERAARMADLTPADAARFVCVEAAAIREPVRLEPGGEWAGSQTLRV